MALSSNIGSNLQSKFGNIQCYTAGAQIYRGATVAIKLTDGKVYPAAEDGDDSEKFLVVGFAMEAASADGDDIRVRQDGKLKRKWQGDISTAIPGQLACVYDDEYVQAPSAGKIVAGRISEVLTTEVFVDLTQRPLRVATGSYD